MNSVRCAGTCDALFNLTVLSTKFTGEALSLLMDILNDDSVAVRLQALATLHHMGMFNSLKLQEAHMHMFLRALNDIDGHVRSALRKLLKLAKRPDLVTFQLSFNGLLESLESYPQDESDVLSVLFHMGQNHVDMDDSVIKDVFEQVGLILYFPYTVQFGSSNDLMKSFTFGVDIDQLIVLCINFQIE